MARVSILSVCAVLLVGCTSSLARTASQEADFVRSGAESRERSAERMVVRRASMTLEANDHRAIASRIEGRVDDLGGYVVRSSHESESTTLSLRVPAEQLDAFLDDVAALGDETHRSVSGEDVGEAYADTEAEIGNLEALRDRLRALLARAEKVEEILEVERELTRVQTRLDSLTAHRDRMAKDVRLSSVSIQVHERPPKRILGPLGLLYAGVEWLAIKLVVISP